MGVLAGDAAYSAAERFHFWFNVFEGLFWMVVGAGFLLRSRRSARGWPVAVAAVLFMLFGGSDFVEVATGAWWRPFWLLVWKGACLVGLVSLYVVHVTSGGARGVVRISSALWRR